MRRWDWWIVGLGTVLLAACKEDLTTPGECPALCPGNAIVVRDTIIEAAPGSDSSYVGYTPRNARQVLLVSQGLAAGEYRSYVVFAKNSRDSVAVDGTNRPFTIDTVALSFTIEARDTLVKGLRLYLYRIPVTTDTSITFAGLTALFTPDALIDSIQVLDTLKAGRAEVLISGDKLAALLPPAADSGRLGVGLALAAEQPTGVRLALDPLLTGTGPLFEYRGLAEGVADTTKKRQKIQVRLETVTRTGYLTDTDLASSQDPDLLYLGGPSAARTLLRFDVPSYIRDSAQIVRATLLLTPAQTLDGLPNNRFGDFVSALGLVVDLGGKSPTASFGLNRGTLAPGSAAEVAVDVYSLVAQWQTTGGAPQGIFLQHSDELVGGGFMQPVFYSTRSPTGRPRLRITYGIPARPGTP